MKAQLCPVCLGKGKIKNTTPGWFYGKEQTCHGCDGKGWVAVPD